MTENTNQPRSNKPQVAVYDGKGNRIGIGWSNEYGGFNIIKSSNAVDGREYIRNIEAFKKAREIKRKQAPTPQP